MARIEPLGPEVLRPHPDPDAALPFGLQPVHDLGEQSPPQAAALPPLDEVDPLQLAAGWRDFGMRQVAGPCQRVPDRLAALLDQPQRPARVGQIAPGLLDRIDVGHKGVQVFGIIQMTERLRKRPGTQS